MVPRQPAWFNPGMANNSPISTLLDPALKVWAYCAREVPCGRAARLDMPAIFERVGDITIDQLRARLRCTGCGWRPGTITVSTSGKPR